MSELGKVVQVLIHLLRFLQSCRHLPLHRLHRHRMSLCLLAFAQSKHDILLDGQRLSLDLCVEV